MNGSVKRHTPAYPLLLRGLSPLTHLILLALMITSLLPARTRGQDSSNLLAVKAEFVREFSLPGRNNQLLRPAAIHIDRKFNEVLVSDPGHNRIVIFDDNGVYRFEFSGGEVFSTPGDLGVDSEGQIYVVGSTRAGKRLFVFDFDGIYLQELELFTSDGKRVDIGSMTLSEQDELFVYNANQPGITVFSPDGELLREIALFEELSERTLNEMIAGTLTAAQGKLFLPLPSMGMVNLYSFEGEFLQSVGYKGSRVGEMSFPVRAALTPDGLLLVLDKHRHNVLCFDQNYQFIGEFGGRGFNPGWFYHPNLLDVDAGGQIYVGQIFSNRIQVCHLPQVISDRRSPIGGNSD